MPVNRVAIKTALSCRENPGSSIIVEYKSLNTHLVPLFFGSYITSYGNNLVLAIRGSNWSLKALLRWAILL